MQGTGLDYFFTYDNPYPAADNGRANILHSYTKGRQHFLCGGYDDMLIIEHDIIPPPDALIKLQSLQCDVAYGLYCFRRDPTHPVNVYRHTTGRYPDQSLSFFKEAYAEAWGNRVPCSGGGLGCVLVQRHVLESVVFRGGNAWVDSYFTEDVCVAGYSMKADMTVKCGHVIDNARIVYPGKEGFVYEAS